MSTLLCSTPQTTELNGPSSVRKLDLGRGTNNLGLVQAFEFTIAAHLAQSIYWPQVSMKEWYSRSADGKLDPCSTATTSQTSPGSLPQWRRAASSSLTVLRSLKRHAKLFW